MPNTIRASVVQACTAAYSLSDTLDKLDRLVKLAKERDNTQLAVFPEALYIWHCLCTPWSDCSVVSAAIPGTQRLEP